MWGKVWALGAATVVLSALLTGIVRRLAMRHGVLDVPNARSSHTTVTPRGGGAAIVLSASIAFATLAIWGLIPKHSLWALLGGGMAIALIGFIDDRRPLPAGMRLAVHLGAAIWAVMWLGGLPAVQLAHHSIQLGWLGGVISVLGLVWVLNLFNFMDGIDGIAASEATFVAWAAAGLNAFACLSGVTPASGVFGAACCGFLLWNWPPAKIFMGDVGSGYLGYTIGVLALAATRESPSAVWVWLILGGAFFVDATVTLLRRAARGERVLEAHRTHAYQWLARRWGSHRRVTVAFILLNVLWLLPSAAVASFRPDYTLRVMTLALLPLAVIAVLAGAGRPEQVDHR